MVANAGLIVNADDLGIHPDINTGIFEAFETGLLTSATMLVTTPFFRDTMDEVSRRGVPVGLHASLTLGRALAPRKDVPDLVDESGNFSLSATKLLFLGRPTGKRQDIYRQIYCELDAQFVAAQSRGLSLTHVDSHQHVHMNPRIFEIVQDLAEKHGIRCLRLSREPLYLFELGMDLVPNMRRLNPAKLALVRLVGRKIKPRLKTADRFFGLMYSGHVSFFAFVRLLNRIARSGEVYELGLHPGQPVRSAQAVYPRSGYNAFISSPSRAAELQLLMDPGLKSLVTEHGIRLMSYRDLT